MTNVFMKQNADELTVQLSDGRMVLLNDLVRDYERLVEENNSKKAVPSQLKVGEWFRIDREIIEKNKTEIFRKCYDAGIQGKELWEQFEKWERFIYFHPERYPRLIETYVFELLWDSKTQQEMQDMCEEKGDGMCDEVICYLELQMRICNGESVDDLLNKGDTLPFERVIKLTNGKTAFFGGGTAKAQNRAPARLIPNLFNADASLKHSTPYAFRRVLS